MSKLDQVVNTARSVEPGVKSGLTTRLVEYLKSPQLGGIEGLVQKFEKAGLGPTIKSWIGGAKPLPVTAAEITRVLGKDAIAAFAGNSGLSATDVAEQLTVILPETIAQLTPNGNVPPSSVITELGSKLTEKIGI